MALVLSVFEQGMIYAIMALGIYITYTILDFPDLTVDGSFPLGAALSAVLITKGVNPLLTLVIAFAAGAVAGTLTGLIHVKLKVRDFLIWNHYDDCFIYSQPSYCGAGKSADLQYDDAF